MRNFAAHFFQSECVISDCECEKEGTMWIRVRTVDGKTVQVRHLSLKTTIEEVRSRLVEHFDVQPNCQRLLHRGKQVMKSVASLINGHLRVVAFSKGVCLYLCIQLEDGCNLFEMPLGGC